MANKSQNGISVFVKLIYAVVVIIVCFAVIAFCARFTNNFTSDFKTFYVEYGGETIINDTTGVKVGYCQENSFGVGYSLGFLSGKNLGYSVEILPNADGENGFEFTVDGETHSYSDEEPLTEYFSIDYSDSGFILNVDKDLPEMLADRYSWAYVSGVLSCFNVDSEDKDLFLLVVRSEDGSTEVRIAFNVVFVFEKLTLNSNHLIF